MIFSVRLGEFVGHRRVEQPTFNSKQSGHMFSAGFYTLFWLTASRFTRVWKH